MSELLLRESRDREELTGLKGGQGAQEEAVPGPSHGCIPGRPALWALCEV